MNEQEDVTLVNLKGGEVAGLFDYKLKQVLADIMDPNTTLETREITIKFKIKPDKNRDFGTVSTSITAKLGKDLPVETKVFIAATKDGPVATEYNPAQQTLPVDLNPGKVTHLRAAGGN
jgi:uncharacterized membrane protein